jgi:hypothetical protein
MDCQEANRTVSASGAGAGIALKQRQKKMLDVEQKKTRLQGHGY